MTARLALLLLIAVAASGCDRITGAAEQKTHDAEAIGYACRVSSKPPADCIADNDTHSPTSILAGWKAADQDIMAKLLDPSMGKDPAMAAHLPVTEEKSKSKHKNEDAPASSAEQAPAESAAETEQPAKKKH